MSGLESERELVEASIERDREALNHAVTGLWESAAASFDPRERIRQRPFAWVIGGFLVGCWLGRR